VLLPSSKVAPVPSATALQGPGDTRSGGRSGGGGGGEGASLAGPRAEGGNAVSAAYLLERLNVLADDAAAGDSSPPPPPPRGSPPPNISSKQTGPFDELPPSTSEPLKALVFSTAQSTDSRNLVRSETENDQGFSL
jgi:hypothetical protein